MKVHIIKNSDLIKVALEGRVSAWGHGANCMGVMGAGFSGLVVKHFPDLYDADRYNHEPKQSRLGKFSAVRYFDTGVIGANLYTQYTPGPDARIAMIKNSIWEFCHHFSQADTSKHYTFGIPALGCGIGGLNISTLLFALMDIEEQDAEIDLLLFIRSGEYIEEVYNISVSAEGGRLPGVSVFENFEAYEEQLCTRLKSSQ
uniref:Macro domain-containing protein n=1 Tax=Serratia phage Kevin TaxID=3161161 RepID=A0AAU8KX39_9CAUD